MGNETEDQRVEVTGFLGTVSRPRNRFRVVREYVVNSVRSRLRFKLGFVFVPRLFHLNCIRGDFDCRIMQMVILHRKTICVTYQFPLSVVMCVDFVRLPLQNIQKSYSSCVMSDTTSRERKGRRERENVFVANL